MQWNQSSAGSSAAPGWYADPGAPGLQRYWDGSQWTGHTAPVGPPAGAAAGKSNARLWIGLGVGFAVLIVVVVVIAAISIFRFSGNVIDWVTEPADTVNEYLAAVKAGDMSEAEALTCEGSDNFEIDFTEEGRDVLVDYYAYSSQRVNNQSWVMFSFETTTGSGDAVAWLEPRGDGLKICDITTNVPPGVFDDSAGDGF